MINVDEYMSVYALIVEEDLSDDQYQALMMELDDLWVKMNDVERSLTVNRTKDLETRLKYLQD